MTSNHRVICPFCSQDITEAKCNPFVMGGLQPISKNTDNNVQLLVDEQKQLMSNLLFSFTNMAAMT